MIKCGSCGRIQDIKIPYPATEYLRLLVGFRAVVGVLYLDGCFDIEWSV